MAAKLINSYHNKLMQCHEIFEEFMEQFVYLKDGADFSWLFWGPFI